MPTQAIQGVELQYVDRGSGMPVVLLHAFPLDHSVWDAQIEWLATQWRVIAPDLRGFGRSSLGADTSTMEQMADDVAGLLDALDVHQPVTLAGLSMGGYVAFQFWRKHAARLRGLMLCDTRAAADTPQAADARHQTAARVLREGTGWLADIMLPKLLSATTREDRPQIVESLRRVILQTNPQGIAAASRGMAQRPDSTALLPEIRCPTLVVVGQQDAVSTVEEMRSMAEAIPQSLLAEIPNAGHLSPLENPAAVSAAMGDFLDRLSLE